MKNTKKLRQLLEGDRLLVSPFTYDALTAKIAESVGFPIVYMSGFATAMSRGYPDVGLTTMTEMVDNARRIANSISVPLIADGDTGYGNAINVRRMIQEYEGVGVSGIHMEDQVFPKKCGFFAGKQVIPLEENIAKLKAAQDARSDKDFVIIARCDALAVNGWEDTIHRCRAYFDAGADIVFVDGVKTLDDLAVYNKELGDLPRMYNGDLASTQEIGRMGFKIMIHRCSMLAVYKSVRGVMEELWDGGIVDSSHYATREEVANFLGLEEIYELENQYTVAP